MQQHQLPSKMFLRKTFRKDSNNELERLSVITLTGDPIELLKDCRSRVSTLSVSKTHKNFTLVSLCSTHGHAPSIPKALYLALLISRVGASPSSTAPYVLHGRRAVQVSTYSQASFIQLRPWLYAHTSFGVFPNTSLRTPHG